MKAIRFKTRISKKGIIRIPENIHVPENEVEIVIIPKSEENEQTGNIKAFLDKWSGFLNDNNTDASKYDYLINKYK